MSKGTIKKVAGPLVIARGMRDANMFDVVRVSDQRLIGEIIEIHGDEASIQVYEETSGLGPGAPVESTGEPMSVELGPGLIGSIYDGIQRPLDAIMRISGNNLKRGVEVPSLKRDAKWNFLPAVHVGDAVVGGDVLGTVQETEIVVHKILVPAGVRGTVRSISAGEYTVTDTVAVIDTPNGSSVNVTLMQKWPVRRGRPYQKKLSPDMPLITGQRVIDTLFPIAKGGVAAVPGPFGSGKTVVQHQLAKWAEADIVVYIGCGERGNEMTDVLNEFPELDRPENRLFPDEAHGADRQHLRHAGRGARGFDLHRHHDRGVLPRHGLFRRPDGGFHLPLGRGAARNVRPSGGDARRRGLPGLPRQPSGAVLRARGPRDCAGQRRARGRALRHRRGFPAGRRYFRAGLAGDAAHRQGLLGP